MLGDDDRVVVRNVDLHQTLNLGAELRRLARTVGFARLQN
jgi:hypothetical protein